ncbi:MAG: prolyl-tRNA synthetase [Cohnella sp.]|nr:prolyl-tRNA synthetase [Cohnella sp.]
MRQSTLFSPTLREAPSDAEVISHQLLLRSGFIRQLASGIYTYLPLGRRVLHKVERIIREEMDRAGAQEIGMPSMQPAELWTESGRYADYGPELIRLKDRHGRDFVLGPTHEEVVTALVGNETNSYRKLPIILYQLQTKFRDERRPRSGLLRGREFLMKDAYSFDTDWSGLEKSYELMYETYQKIFRRLGLNFRAVEADAGTIGGEGETHEFMALADIGEDTIVACTNCDYAANVEHFVKEGETVGLNGDHPCPRCAQGTLHELKGIEVGHVFKLGTRYSERLQATFADSCGIQKLLVMGCYGIGVSRILSAIVEQNHDDKGIIWPPAIAPYHVHVVPISTKDEVQMNLAEQVYQTLCKLGIEVLIDDRDERPGVKFTDSEMIGLPVQMVIGKQAAEGYVEYKDRSSKERKIMGVDEVVSDITKRFKPN